MAGPVTRIGITGHRVIPDAALPVVRSGIRAELRGIASARVLSSLAEGADQMFAEIALEYGIPLTAVIPATDYEAHLGDDRVKASYRRLLKCSAERVELPYERTHDEAYYAAGRYIVDHADRMLAVWDGAPSRGLGGTADIVDYARHTGVPVTVLWSPGVRRA
ncbi:hypothetical protein PV416_37795 [Streptomyces ipomoeae]|jgi:hypothetical protein|uniref:Uncharacterized protein n=1 Tax=Streptomyces ipomoeae 91-03 TaxID=698759 RepID=L1L3Y3_9ACTN|nr:hypothetical protein [Streptomyces ipomoeae]EKX67415.1 hypothetical protein STRIP9103_02845 [Streptomyces ipomoeae 91-03]MDX2700631.1 hypothetical protein [Streptomyces ipomoeae]MDX2826675.1 hypothetical protein [Streptomyces ipomoeae]MDX2846157.1 hypothetical protein [Streptomyces ipomoeae]MDX2873799.1 hypothetical protein [Streptomyces ipomoeae]